MFEVVGGRVDQCYWRDSSANSFWHLQCLNMPGHDKDAKWYTKHWFTSSDVWDINSTHKENYCVLCGAACVHRAAQWCTHSVIQMYSLWAQKQLDHCDCKIVSFMTLQTPPKKTKAEVNYSYPAKLNWQHTYIYIDDINNVCNSIYIYFLSFLWLYSIVKIIRIVHNWWVCTT